MEDVSGLEISGNLELPDQKLAYDDLLAMVQQLPQAYRTVFNLYAIEGYNHDEISQLLGINEGSSKSNLFRAREKLRKMIEAASKLPQKISGSPYSGNDILNFKTAIIN